MKPGLVEALATAYAVLMKRQRTASSAFVRWSSAHARAHEFAWMEAGREELMTSGCEIKVGPGSSIHDAINKMMATAQLNPYERARTLLVFRARTLRESCKSTGWSVVLRPAT
jgi:hypothetical protein